MQRKTGGQILAPRSLPGYNYNALDNQVTDVICAINNFSASQKTSVTIKTQKYLLLMTARDILNNYRMLLPFSWAHIDTLITCYHLNRIWPKDIRSQFKAFLKQTIPFSNQKISLESLYAHYEKKTIATFIEKLLPIANQEIEAALYPKSLIRKKAKKEKILTVITIASTVISGITFFGLAAQKSHKNSPIFDPPTYR